MPATKYVPASIRSKIIVCSAAFKDETPLTIIVFVPRPFISAPILLRHTPKSTTSGSFAAFSKTVMPSAKIAAIIKFSVPVTVTWSMNILQPINLLLGKCAVVASI